MTTLAPSQNLALNELVAQRRAAGETVVHLGFGEARLPVFEPLRRALEAGASENAYGPVAGERATREAVAGYFARRGLPTDADQIVLGPGSKPLLMALQLAVRGDVLVPAPAWNTYRPQVELAGKVALGVPIPAECGGVPDPRLLPTTIAAARAHGHDPRALVVTLPDNPTGTLASRTIVEDLCAVARDEDLLIVSDEIYRDVVHRPDTKVYSPALAAPERTVVTAGLSKSLALGGWRIGVARFPATDRGDALRADALSVASELWSVLARPMQAVARYAYDEPPELRAHLAACARLHGAVAREVHRIVVSVGARCRPPTGGFYVYPDFEPLRPLLARGGVVDSRTLQRRLADECGLVVLAGHLLGDDPRALRCKMATSMLYGDTAELQWRALHAPDPLALPHVRELVGSVREGLRQLCE